MKTFLYSLPFWFCLSLFSSCEKLGLCKHEAFDLQKEAYKGRLRIDGCYYGSPDTSSDGKIRYNLFVFYGNGVMSAPGSVSYDEIDDYIGYADPQRSQYGWGLFQSGRGPRILLEYWTPRPCGLWVRHMEGNIVDDTTFVLNYIRERKKAGKESEKVNEVYRFRYVFLKPDSTNKYIP